ncbi:hypothetical protein PQX77_014930, partial [Marasmius sp. AFHP31]
MGIQNVNLPYLITLLKMKKFPVEEMLCHTEDFLHFSERRKLNFKVKLDTHETNPTRIQEQGECNLEMP